MLFQLSQQVPCQLTFYEHLVSAMDDLTHLIWIFLIYTSQVYEKTIIIPISLKRKLTQSVAKEHVQSHTAFKDQLWDAHMGHRIPHTHTYITHKICESVRTPWKAFCRQFLNLESLTPFISTWYIQDSNPRKTVHWEDSLIVHVIQAPTSLVVRTEDMIYFL